MRSPCEVSIKSVANASHLTSSMKHKMLCQIIGNTIICATLFRHQHKETHMYCPATFAETDPETLQRLIEKHPLGLLITSGASGLLVSPLPFLFSENEQGARLVAHIAKANPHWRDLAGVKECLVVFQGAENYVSPSWYPSKAITHKVVPTWNYEMVQVKGKPKIFDSAEWLSQQVANITNHFEKERKVPWKPTDAPPDFIDSQLKAIVGIEIEISEIKGKWKMSQNRSPEDAAGVASGLADTTDPHADPTVAAIVASRIKT